MRDLLSERCVCFFGGGQITPSCRDSLSCSGAFGGAFLEPPPGIVAIRLSVGSKVVKPVWDLHSWPWPGCWDSLGEGSPLRGGRDVGTVDGDGGFEDTDGVGEVVGVRHQCLVVVASSGHADIQPAAGGGAGGEGDGPVGGGALGAVLGTRIRQLHVLVDVVGGQGDGAVSAESGHGDLTAVGVGVGDGPAFTVADTVTGTGAELSAVATSDDDVTDHRPVPMRSGLRWRGRVRLPASGDVGCGC